MVRVAHCRSQVHSKNVPVMRHWQTVVTPRHRLPLSEAAARTRLIPINHPWSAPFGCPPSLPELALRAPVVGINPPPDTLFFSGCVGGMTVSKCFLTILSLASGTGAPLVQVYYPPSFLTAAFTAEGGMSDAC